MNQFLLEEGTVKAAFVPVDMNTAAITGARVNMANAFRVSVVVTVGASLASTVAFTLRQHNAATAGTSKDLSIANKYFVKVAAATSFTKVEPTVDAALYDLSTTFSTDLGIVVFEVLASQLDVEGGFGYFSLDVADSGATKLGSGLYVIEEVRLMPGYDVVL